MPTPHRIRIHPSRWQQAIRDRARPIGRAHLHQDAQSCLGGACEAGALSRTLTFGKLGPVFDFSQQLRLDPDAAMRDFLGVGLCLADDRRHLVADVSNSLLRQPSKCSRDDDQENEARQISGRRWSILFRGGAI